MSILRALLQEENILLTRSVGFAIALKCYRISTTGIERGNTCAYAPTVAAIVAAITFRLNPSYVRAPPDRS